MRRVPSIESRDLTTCGTRRPTSRSVIHQKCKERNLLPHSFFHPFLSSSLLNHKSSLSWRETDCFYFFVCFSYMFAHVSNVVRKCRTVPPAVRQTRKQLRTIDCRHFFFGKKKEKRTSQRMVRVSSPTIQDLRLSFCKIYPLTANIALRWILLWCSTYFRNESSWNKTFFYTHSCYFALVMHMHTHTRIQCFWGIYKCIFARQLNDNGCSIPLSIFAHIYQVILVYKQEAKQCSLRDALECVPRCRYMKMWRQCLLRVSCK